MVGCSGGGRYWLDCGMEVRWWRGGGFLIKKQTPALWLPNKNQEHPRYAFGLTLQKIIQWEMTGNFASQGHGETPNLHWKYSMCLTLWEGSFSHQGNSVTLSWQLQATGIDPSRASCASLLYCPATHMHTVAFLVTPQLLHASARGSVRWKYKCGFWSAAEIFRPKWC